MHHQESLTGYQCCAWGTSARRSGEEMDTSAGSVEVLHAPMVLLAFLYHGETLRREEAFHVTWSSRNWRPVCSSVWAQETFLVSSPAGLVLASVGAREQILILTHQCRLICLQIQWSMYWGWKQRDLAENFPAKSLWRSLTPLVTLFFSPQLHSPRSGKNFANKRPNPLLWVTSVCVGRTELSVPLLHFKYSLDSELVLETVLCRCYCLHNKWVINWILCQLLAT